MNILSGEFKRTCLTLTAVFTFFFIGFGCSHNLSAQNSGFAEPVPLASNEAANVFDVRFADLNADGDKDIVATTPYGVNWHENLGNGEFGPVRQILTLKNSSQTNKVISFDVGDANNNGRVDIALVTYDELSVLTNDGNGNFQEAGTMSTGRFTQYVVIGKLHADSLNSIYVTSYQNDFQNFNISDNEINEHESIDIERIDSKADVNSDGYTDFISSYDLSSGIYFLDENGNTSYTGLQIPEKQTARTINVDINFDDINNNTFKDLLVSTEIEHSLRRDEIGYLVIYENSQGTSFNEPVKIDSISLGFSSAVFLDVDQDGLKDIVASSINSGYQESELFWYKNLSDGHFSEANLFKPTYNTYDKLIAEDINSDGLTDLLAISASGDEIAWFKNEEGDEFGEKQVIGASQVSSPVNMTSFDVDMDGLNDLVVASENGEKAVSWFKNTGNFQFDGPNVIDASGGKVFYLAFSDLQHADLDQDGYQDLLFMVFSGLIEQIIDPNGSQFKRYSWLVKYMNNGDGSFSSADTVYSGYADFEPGYNFSAGDYDGDGDIDIAAYGLWFENGGNGSFTDSGKKNQNGLHVASADINNDGMDEFISSYVATETICEPICFNSSINKVIFNNFGSDSSSNYQVDIHYDAGRFESLTNADLNNDNQTDLVFSSSTDKNLNFWDNEVGYLSMEADSVWEWVTIDSSNTNFIYANVGDLDADGNQDVLSLTEVGRTHFEGPYLEGKILWHKNDGTGSFTTQPYVDSTNVDMQQAIASDLNNDNYPEIITLFGEEEKILVHPNEIKNSVTTETINTAPQSYTLSQNYPNPFNPSTTISFSIPEADFVELNVYNLIGQRVKILVNEQKTAGVHQATFNAGSLSSGIYFYQLKAGDFTINKKMVLVK